MRIAIVGFTPAGRGGMENVFAQMHACLVEMGHLPGWFFPGRPADHPEWPAQAFEGNCQFYQPEVVRDSQHLLEEMGFELHRSLTRFKPDVVVVATGSNAGVLLVAKIAVTGLGPNVPLLSWAHASIRSMPIQWQGTFRWMDGHLAIASGIQRELTVIDPEKPCSVILNPVRDFGSHVVSRARTPTFIYVGRLDIQQKRLDRLFRAMAAILPRVFRLRIFGSAPEGDRVQEELAEMARILGLANRIDWEGWHENPWAQIPEATALVLTSDFEGMPLVLAEALTHGVPVVASDCPTGPRDIVRTGVNGYLFDPAEEEQLVGLLAGIVDGNIPLPDPRSCIRSVERFRPETVARRFVMAIQSMQEGIGG